jgi:filamentous hemagglutinin
MPASSGTLALTSQLPSGTLVTTTTLNNGTLPASLTTLATSGLSTLAAASITGSASAGSFTTAGTMSAGASTLASANVSGDLQVSGTTSLGVTHLSSTALSPGSIVTVTDANLRHPGGGRIGILLGIDDATATNYGELSFINVGGAGSTSNEIVLNAGGGVGITVVYDGGIFAGSQTIDDGSGAMKVGGPIQILSDSLLNSGNDEIFIPSTGGSLALLTDIPGSGSSPTYSGLTVTGTASAGSFSTAGTMSAGASTLASVMTTNDLVVGGNMTGNNLLTLGTTASNPAIILKSTNSVWNIFAEGSASPHPAANNILGVFNSSDNSNPFTITQTNKVSTLNSTLDNGSGDMTVAGTLTVTGNTLKNSSANSISLPSSAGTLALTSQLPSALFQAVGYITGTSSLTCTFIRNVGVFTTSGAVITFPVLNGASYRVSHAVQGSVPAASQCFVACTLTNATTSGGSTSDSVCGIMRNNFGSADSMSTYGEFLFSSSNSSAITMTMVLGGFTTNNGWSFVIDQIA